MSGISALQFTGLDAASPAKPGYDAPSQTSAPSAPVQGATPVSTSSYPSPVFAIDAASSRVIFEYRDAKTGEVTQQLPSKDAVALYEASAGRSEHVAASEHKHSTSL